MVGRPFDFFSTPRIVFGRGVIARLGDVVRPLGGRALVVFNGAAQPQVVELLAAAGAGQVSLRQRGEPTTEHIAQGVGLAQREHCDVVIGVGGGSAIDAAKAIAGVVANGGGVLDYMEVVGAGKPIAKPALPWVAVPTTAGTGAEVTRNAVIGEPSKKFKASLRSELLLPRVALVDPELGAGVPPAVTASSGMDALCQLIESFTSTNAQPMTDALAREGIERAARSLARAYRDGADLDAREDMALAALLSGITLTNAGLGAVHGFAAPLGANFPVPHGTACAALLPHVMAANVAALRAQSPAHPTLARYAIVGRLLAAQEFGSDAAAIDAGVERVAQLSRELNIPRLSHYGLTERHVPDMVALARRASSMRYNPVVLTDAVLADVLRRAI
ncbi:MAG TPA: iron-containing alcohol dehydrogenase [Tepidisphaeraceae bacterium]|nr:iron-containing alcohol dehydrogenase [Tepidisphaeraceae bacterium]